jgi:xanthine dehydrogenase molybdenum-binding subunit
VVEREFRTAMVHQGYIEPQAATAAWGPDGVLTVHATTQGGFDLRDQIATLLGLPLSRVRVVPTEVGGAFGGKIRSAVEVVAALLSRKCGKPVKIAMSRAEVLLATGPTPGSFIKVKMGVRRTGDMVAATAELYYEAGAYPGSAVDAAARTIFAPYDIANVRIDGFDVVVNKPQTAAYRAPGATPAAFAGEQVVDEIARRLGVDPVELRLRNVSREGTRLADGTVLTNIGAREVLEAARASAHYKAALPGPNRGRGFAQGFWGNWGAQSSCVMSINADGTVAMVTGNVDLTGSRTSLAMQAAEALGLPVDRIRPRVGDTDSTGYANVSAGSRTTVACGLAVLRAAGDLLAQLKTRAATLLQTTGDAVEYREGVFTARDAGGKVTFAEIAAKSGSTGGPITVAASVNMRQWGAAYGAHIVDVEVDPETGKVRVLRYTAVQDVGRAIHPTGVEGQLRGGAAQGIGWALYEGYEYDRHGRLLNPNLLDNKLPTALDVPPIETVIVEVPCKYHPHGARGVGEVPIVPPPAAIANAIAAATGARLTRLPMTPARILEATGVLKS